MKKLFAALLTIACIFSIASVSFASSDNNSVSMSVIHNTEELLDGHVYDMCAGDKIFVYAHSNVGSKVGLIGYYYQDLITYQCGWTHDFETDNLIITIPKELKVGERLALFIDAAQWKLENTENNTGWQCYFINIVDKVRPAQNPISENTNLHNPLPTTNLQ